MLSSSDFHKRKSVDELSARKESFNQGDKESRSRQSSDGKPEISTQTSLRVKNVAKSPLSAISPSNIEENPQREVDIESGDVPAAIQKLSINTVKEGSKTLPRLGIKPQIDISTVPATPLITNTPKRSWFATLLNFKPETYTLVSVVGLEESMNKMALVLKRSDIRYQMRREGFKCKFENDGTSPMTPIEPSTGNSPTDKNEKGDKSVKFKIDVVAGTDGVRMTFVHQQGAYSIFQSLVEVVRGTFNEAT